MRRRQKFAQQPMTVEEREKVEEPTDAELRKMYRLKFGKKPGRMKRATMLERINDVSD